MPLELLTLPNGEGGKMKKNWGRKIACAALSMTIAATILLGTGVSSLAYTQTTGTVTSDNVKVRSSASTTSSQVSSLKNGDKVDIVDESTDASGYVWYKIYVNKNEFGYVRSDLVKKAGGSSTSTSTSASTTPASLPETSVTSTEQRTGTITSETVNVRQGAGTAYDSVGKVAKGDTVTITGEATGTDNKTWYQVTFGANSKTGFVRSDLLSVNEAAPAETENTENTENQEAQPQEGAEGEAEEQQTSSNTVVSDAGDGTYSLVYTTDESGAGIWYLYDNVGGYRVKVNELIDAAQSASQINDLKKANKNYKKIVIALAVVIAALIAGLVLLALKLRDSLYYEDEEEEEYDRYTAPSRSRDRDVDDSRTARRTRDNTRESRVVEPERPVRRPAEDANTVRPTRRPVAEDSQARPVRRTTEEQMSERPVRRTDRSSMERSDDSYQTERPVRRTERTERDYETDRDPRREARKFTEDKDARRPAASSARRNEEPASKRKPKNFIGDDDFDFEFLDLDD